MLSRSEFSVIGISIMLMLFVFGPTETVTLDYVVVSILVAAGLICHAISGLEKDINGKWNNK